MFLAAGESAAVAVGTDWDTLVAERIFEPLGMDSSTTSVAEAQADPRLSLGYMWDVDLETHDLRAMQPLDNIAPAGAINSSVLDMAQWLRLLLGDGVHEGVRLISEEQLQETRTTQIEIAEGVGYGLGWLLREWEGQPVVEHGGNVDGFGAQVALLPGSDLGFVLLTNVTATPLQQASVNMVWEALLGKWVEEDAEDIDFAPYLGAYVLGGEMEYTVVVQNGRLAVDVPGQTVYELKPPDEEGKRYFAVTDTVAVSFELDDEGNVVMMKLYQSGLTLEFLREGVEAAPQTDTEAAQPHLGTYRSEDLGLDVEVLVQNGRLAVDVPGQIVYELHPPDDEGRWLFRISADLSVVFHQGPDGGIESLTMYQGDLEYPMPRVAGASLPTVEEILDLRNTESRRTALEAMGAYRFLGTIRVPQSGIEGTFSLHIRGADHFLAEMDFGRFGSVRTALDGDRGWTDSSFSPSDELHGRLLEQTRLNQLLSLSGDWRDFFDAIEVIGAGEFDGTTVYFVDLGRGDLPTTTVTVDAETGDVLRAETVALLALGGGIPVATRFEDYREVEGVRLPHLISDSNEASGESIIQIEAVQVDLDVPDDFFVLTPDD